MQTNEFKKQFGETAKTHSFTKAHGGWFQESAEVITVLDLQKSNYSNLYYLNIKLYIQGCFANNYAQSKKLVKIDGGDVFLRQPTQYNNLFDLENSLDDDARQKGLEEFFNDYLTPFCEHTSSKEGIKCLHKKGELFILPAVKIELEIA